jgi:sugar phosphate isomerase/epimerase
MTHDVDDREPSGSSLGDVLMLCNVSVANLPLQEVVPAAGAAGFDCISVLARSHRRCTQRDEWNDADLARLVDDSGLWVHEVEAIGDWLSAPPKAERTWLDPVYDIDELFAVAAALGARQLVAVHFGEPAPFDVAATAFAALCDRAADVGMTVALEFPAMATIADLRTAWEVVRSADRGNGGILLDLWHHRRSSHGDADLADVPADRILSVQLGDGTAEPVGPPLEDVVHRCLPGDGDFDVVGVVADLDRRGVRCPLGIEVLQPEIVEDGAGPAAERLYRSLAAVVANLRAR